MPFTLPEPDGEIDDQPGYICPKCGVLLVWTSFHARCMNRKSLHVELPDWRKQSWCWPCREQAWKHISAAQLKLFQDSDPRAMPEDFPDAENQV